MNNQDRRFKKTEDAIQKSLIVLLQKQNLDSLDFQKVIREADINKSTFYLHYQSLSDAFKALEDRCLSLCFEALNGDSSEPKEILRSLSLVILSEKKMFYAVVSSSSSSFLSQLIEGALPLLGERGHSRALKYDSSLAFESSSIMGIYCFYRLWILSSCRAEKEKVEGDAIDFWNRNQSDFSKR
jgi:AcrR family transcriptional regulator